MPAAPIFTPQATQSGAKKKGNPEAGDQEKGARAVRAVHNAVRARCGHFPRARTTFSFPLCCFLAPHHYLPLPCGEPVCRGCGIGRASLESKGK